LPRIHFQQQLAELKDRLLAMAALAQQAVEASVDSYLQRDAGLSQYVKENETAINSAQRQVDEMAYELLAKEQPMAIDLRFIVAVIKINGDLERIGDQSMSIAVRTRELLEHAPVDLPVDIARMAEYASRMIRSAIQALLDADARVADSVIEMGDRIDLMNRVAQDELMRVMQEHSQASLQALNALVIAHNLKRIAGHAASIATDVIFWIRGADVRHQLNTAAD
jgi:phosphate transport system protein